MKKEWGFLIIILLFSITLAGAVQYSCPNERDLSEDSKEIEEGKTKSILGLSIGVCGASENSFQKWIESQVFLDANLVIIKNSSSSTGTELASGNSTVSYSNLGESKAKIKIGSSSSDLEIGDCSLIGNTAAMLTEILGEGLTAELKVLVAAKKETLNTQQNPAKIVEVNSKKYGVQLFTGSQTQSTIKLSTCKTGDILEIAAPSVDITNSTINNETNQTINIPANVSSAGENDTTNNMQNTSQDIASQNQEQEEIGLFKRLWDWIKGLFS